MPDPIAPMGVPGQPTRLPASPPAAEAFAQGVDPVPQVLPNRPGPAQEARTQAGAVPAGGADPRPVSLDEAVKMFREYLKNLPSNLQFTPDEESGYVIFKVVNPVTQEVIRQYPPDEVVKMAKFLKSQERQGKTGIFLDRNL